jgi:hypothetical protein
MKMYRADPDSKSIDMIDYFNIMSEILFNAFILYYFIAITKQREKLQANVTPLQESERTQLLLDYVSER